MASPVYSHLRMRLPIAWKEHVVEGPSSRDDIFDCREFDGHNDVAFKNKDTIPASAMDVWVCINEVWAEFYDTPEFDIEDADDDGFIMSFNGMVSCGISEDDTWPLRWAKVPFWAKCEDADGGNDHCHWYAGGDHRVEHRDVLSDGDLVLRPSKWEELKKAAFDDRDLIAKVEGWLYADLDIPDKCDLAFLAGLPINDDEEGS